jgi:peroxiredoxin
LHADLQRRGLVVAGISPRSREHLARLRSQHELSFPLLSDNTKSVARMYEVNGLLGVGVRRSTYLISQGRIIVGSVIEPLRIAKHLAFMREAPELLLAMPTRF